MQILDGKEVSNFVIERVGKQVKSLNEKHTIQPGLAVVLIGEDPASQVYVNMKVKKCEALSIYSEKHSLEADASQDDVINLVKQLNADPKINGILVQSPPPPHIDEREIIDTVAAERDVDCFHPTNVGKMLIGDEDGFVPCTPAGVMEIIKYYGIETSGMHAVVIGRSNIVGKPMQALLSRKGRHANCTVTMCHSGTKDLASIVSQGDLIVAAVGRPEIISGDMVKEGAIVIDVGINRVDDPAAKRGYRLVGDVDFEAASARASAITPVPGGVGPMTIAMLMQNTVTACCQQNNIDINTL